MKTINTMSVDELKESFTTARELVLVLMRQQKLDHIDISDEEVAKLDRTTMMLIYRDDVKNFTRYIPVPKVL
jgi:hypothetical protein